MDKMLIGIGGCSNSGKSALAHELKSLLGENHSIVLCQDDFVKYSSELPRINGHVDWEQPSSIKYDIFTEAVKSSLKSYDYVIIEGLFAFWFEELNAMYDLAVFLELDKETFIKRKSKDLRWGEEPAWYMEHIYSSYLKYGRPKGDINRLLTVDANSEIDVKALYEYILQTKEKGLEV